MTATSRAFFALLSIALTLVSCDGSHDVAVDPSTSTAVTTTAVTTTSTTTTSPSGNHWAEQAFLNRCPPAANDAARGFDTYSTVHEAVVVIGDYPADSLDSVWLAGSDQARIWIDYPGPNDVPISSTWLANSIGDLELVVCIDFVSTNDIATTCEYSGGREVVYLRRDVSITAYDAATGDVVSQEVIRGPTQKDCPTLESFEEGQTTRTSRLDVPPAAVIKDRISDLIAPGS